ncbi:epoxide hydrolase family protein [Plantibacter sp. Mn2098]|uniref:epoxide hydrolase family protein n=1 Tax=Plantibacter sp. Mn2098 TaxID=3395266 RepID=UPI003BDC32D6
MTTPPALPTPVPAPITEAAVADLIERVQRTRWINNPWADDPARGIPGRTLDALLEHWGDDYDWRAHESRIRELPWVLTGAEGDTLRSIHQPSADPSATAVVLLHGWPDSVLRFERVLPLLGDVHVVVPALPGFPFSVPVSATGSASGSASGSAPGGEAMSVERIADVVAAALAELGYERYVVSGGDVGGMVAEVLAAKHPDRVAALHLTNVAPAHAATVDIATVPADVAAYLRGVGQWRQGEAGFIAEQATRPSTLIASLGDSPAGLLAWVGEKLLAWSDGAGAGRDVPAFSPDELLTWVSAYWFSGTIGTSFSTYVEPAVLPAHIDAPTVVSAFANDIIPAPRSFAELFVDVREFIEHSDGGHFAAWERPEAYAADLRRAVELSRS